MGHRFSAVCNECGTNFLASEGGGFFFHLLHCEKCGKERSISFNEISDIHARYLKGLSGRYSIATSAHDEVVKRSCRGKPLSQEDYHRKVEEWAGKCNCRGSYRFEAPPRCPKCKSTNFGPPKDGIIVDSFYD
jgi:Zn finger protein HypA/HybF involved in hydrogenase expression